MKVFHAVAEVWEELFRRRRKVQPNDKLLITDKDAQAGIWTEWCNAWLYTNLPEKHCRTKRSNPTTILNAHMKQTYGHKYFVFGMLQTGVT